MTKKATQLDLLSQPEEKTNGLPAVKQSHAMVTLSPIPKEHLIRLQKFQKQLDKPPANVIKEQIGQETFYHIPISYAEHLLKKLFFGLYAIEVIHYGMIVNEITVHVRVKVFHPILGQWMSYDGLGAIPILQDAGTKVSEFIAAKKRKALSLNLPAAYSVAVKNACKKMGKVFGGDLNRKHEDEYMEFNIQPDSEPLND